MNNALSKNDSDEVDRIYSQRLEERRAGSRHWARRELWISNARVAVFLLGVIVAWLAFDRTSVSWWWLGVPVVSFAVLAFLHEGVLRRKAAADRAALFYKVGLARRHDQWAGSGHGGEALTSDDHPYARHLDLFGTGSLFELLCLARTTLGQRRLARWLQTPASAAQITERQAAVGELRPRLDAREDHAVSFALPHPANTASLAEWSRRPPIRGLVGLRWAAAALAAVTVAALIGWWWPGIGPYPLLALLTAEFVFVSRVGKRLLSLERDVDVAVVELGATVSLLRHLEGERFESDLLRNLQQSLREEDELPSQRMKELRRLLDLLDSIRNDFFAPVAAILMWRTQVGLAIEAWRARHGGAVERWLEALAEYEVLQSLAGYAYENPECPFPEVLDGSPLWQGEAVGHPLLPRDGCVRNDVTVGGEAALLIVSGSNMSGKTTLLRTIGVNTVLAACGAPVRARRLALTPTALAASIFVQDSLLRGASRFFAQVEQLRAALDLAQQRGTVLFLVDEILSGTNSRDRLIGGEAVLKRLLDLGAMGSISTHDLALTRIAEGLPGRATNAHFADQIHDGKMVFDYRLRPGVVEGSNALAVMRSVGLLEEDY